MRSPSGDEKVAYHEHIQPILAENCFSCHGPDSSTRKGKQVLNVDAGDEAKVCIPVAPGADHVATIGDNRKLLIFPLAEVPEMARGKGVRLQRYKDGDRMNHWFIVLMFFCAGLSGLAFFHPAFFPFTQFFGGPVWARILHPYIGIARPVIRNGEEIPPHLVYRLHVRPILTIPKIDPVYG